MTISLDFLDQKMEYREVTTLFVKWSEPGPTAKNKVDIYFEI
jgi:hypothetical protein